MMLLTTPPDQFPDYQLLDSGEGQKLEMISGVKVIRPSSQAIWKKRLKDNEWHKAQSICHRQKDGGGHWEHLKPLPTQHFLKLKLVHDYRFALKFTSFGHCGIFFEQYPLWKKLEEKVSELKNKLGRAPRVMNLFAYTGAASIVMARAGAEVYHVDSSKGVVEWAMENAKHSQIPEGKIKWQQDDVQKFLIHAFNKNLTFDGVLADPPTWGHGKGKEVWDFEKHIQGLIFKIQASMNKGPGFMLLTSHTPGVQAEAIKNLLMDYSQKKHYECGDLGVRHVNDERVLSAGIYALSSI